eukprot:CAMPEP_0184483262 /NCGR_PEP_ID=MMETSP0113_2-20130426/4907_1 /TAXON_ID=91329 /ORGANISM="Norrisiella sphaerica, Strain BC52" /LENGTH=246 /DNA_ID=CAMNT_0026863549 /DNA_START=113 /DNA_END=853 /DNA_ORIENTATION=-
MRRSPFVIYAKVAPPNLPLYNEDSDFPYFFFSDNIKSIYGLTPQFLCSGRNAKADHPDDYQNYFKDDVGVCQRFKHPKIKRIVEHWRMPAMHTTVLIRKTAMDFGVDRHLLGCFSPFDDVELGVTSFCAGKLPERLKEIETVPEEWYVAAWKHLPNAAMVLDGDGTVVEANALVTSHKGEIDSVMKPCLEQVYSTLELDSSLDSWKFWKKTPEGNKVRIWISRPDPESSYFHMSLRPKHDILTFNF